MRIAILHNQDSNVLEYDPGREAREDVERVAQAMEHALRHKKRSIEVIGVDNNLTLFMKRLDAFAPDVVVNLCESLAADSRGEMLLPAVLDMLGIAYTGNSALSLTLSLHKDKTKELLKARGVPTPDFMRVDCVADLKRCTLPFPLIVKPCREDASAGIDFESVVNDKASLERAVSRVISQFRQPALLETYIEGREVYVPLFGNATRRALPLTEIRFGDAFKGKPNIVSYTAKWHENSKECIESPSVAAELTPAESKACVEAAMRAFDAIEGRDYGRIDIRLAKDGTPYVIDVNPNCDLHPHAGFAKAVDLSGLTYSQLATHLLEFALERTQDGNQGNRRIRHTPVAKPSVSNRDVLSRRGGMRARAH